MPLLLTNHASQLMATQQQGAPTRPWFRLATMVRPPAAQQPDQAPPPPRPAFIRPTFTQVPPPPPPPPPPDAVAPTSPPRATPSPTVPSASPTIPRVVTSSPPPSPLLLPTPQLNTYQLLPEYEQKTVLTQETKKKPNGETHKKKSDFDDVRMRIITIAGENKGAIMEVTPFKKDNHPVASSDGDSEGKKKNSKTPVMNAIMNSNVQGVNNSILYNCSTSHHDPGVHLSLSRKPNSGTK